MQDAPEPVQAAWQRAVDAWGEPAQHDAFLARVAEHRCFAWAAARYRERAGDPIADAQLARLQKSAMATLLATAGPRPDDQKSPYRATMLLFVVLVLVAIVGMVVVAVKHAQHTSHVPPDRPAPGAWK